jgi:hypothetical protein
VDQRSWVSTSATPSISWPVKARLIATLDRFEQAPTAAARRRIEGGYYIQMAAAAQSVRLIRQEIE